MKEHNILIVGANRGLGRALADEYAKAHKTVYATARHEAPKAEDSIYWIPQVDITNERAGIRVAASYGSSDPIDVLIIAAGYFAKETLGSLDYNKQVEMYKTAAIGPLFLIQHLIEKQLLKKGSRIVLVGGESGSIALRHGGRGGNYGGHGSKAAVNMMGKLLSVDLEPMGIPVGIVHTGYLRKHNPDGSFEYSDKNAISPEAAAETLRQWIHTFDMSKTGQFWSIRGPEGIKAAERVLGKDKFTTPMELPW